MLFVVDFCRRIVYLLSIIIYYPIRYLFTLLICYRTNLLPVGIAQDPVGEHLRRLCRIYIHIYTYMYVCKYICMYICMYICRYVHSVQAVCVVYIVYCILYSI
jgi:hypothetical protein